MGDLTAMGSRDGAKGLMLSAERLLSMAIKPASSATMLVPQPLKPGGLDRVASQPRPGGTLPRIPAGAAAGCCDFSGAMSCAVGAGGGGGAIGATDGSSTGARAGVGVASALA